MTVTAAEHGAAAARPRAKDLARAIPGTGDLAALDDAKIIAAPDDPRDLRDWRAALARWRSEARARVTYDGRRYGRPERAWTQSCFSLGFAWLWDERLYDRARDGFRVDAFLAHDAAAAGLDAVLLWHAYPVIGIDERDQFDLARCVPRLPGVVRGFQERGVRVLLEYQAWDRGRAGRDDAAEIAALVRATGADGVFLDTLREAPEGMRDRLDGETSAVLESESNIPLARIADHEMSWAQWQADSPAPGVLRAKWFEPRHMLHVTRRWDTDRTAQLRTAWLNGAGMVVWDAVFGSWVGWNARDVSAWRSMRRILRRFVPFFTQGAWTPRADAAGGSALAFASRFDLEASRLWTIFGDGVLGPAHALEADARDGERWFELVSGRELTAEVRGGRALVRLPAAGRPFAAVLALPPARVDASLMAFLRGSAALEGADDATFPARAPARIAAPAASARGAPEGMIAVRGGPRTITIRYRLRETGMYEGAPFLDAWKPLPPLLHREAEEERAVDLRPFAVGEREVSNDDYARFLAASGYRPSSGEGFLAHWSGGLPSAGQGAAPVRYVDLDDARAYAAWARLRLPTEVEWQVAAGEPGFRRGEPMVWNWTESEHTDGRTRFVVLKGGARWRAEGSEWYADGGPLGPDVSFKLLRAEPAIERSPSIGFRCAVTLEDPR